MQNGNEEADEQSRAPEYASRAVFEIDNLSRVPGDACRSTLVMLSYPVSRLDCG